MNNSPQRGGKKHLTASALIMHDGRFLVHFHKKIGKWLYPGGHVEHDEEPQHAVVREVLEETGIVVNVLSASQYTMKNLNSEDVWSLPVPIAVLAERIGATAKEEEHWHIDMIYVCMLSGGDVLDDALVEGFRWVEIEEIESMNSPAELPDLMRQAKSFLEGRSLR